MIETIHKKEVTAEETAKKQNLVFKMPKNIKQIGKTGHNPEIYIEDYAETYLRRLSECDYTECRAAVLVGEVVQLEKNRVVFIQGAVEAEGAVQENELHFTQAVWDTVYEQMKTYFPNREVVGWFLGGPGFLLEAEEMLLRTHLDQFAGKDRIFYKVDSVEKEAKFYLYEQSCLCLRSGFYIYYEKNEEMQNYMLSRKVTRSTEFGFEEPTVKELRQVLQKKQQEQQQTSSELLNKRQGKQSILKQKGIRKPQDGLAVQEKEEEKQEEIRQSNLQAASTGQNVSGVTRLFYIAGTLAAFTILMIGMAVLQSLEPQESMQNTLNPQNVGELLSPTPEFLPQITEAQIQEEESTDIFSYLESQGVVFNQTVTEIPITNEAQAKPTDIVPTEKPTATPTAVPGEAEEVLADNGIDTEDYISYTVQPGDTLAGICYRQYGSTVRMQEIQTINQIANENKIYSGQVLLLPE